MAAFIPSGARLPGQRAPAGLLGARARRTGVFARTSRPRMSGESAPPPPDEGYELDTEALKDKAMEVVSDVSTRPFYYGKIAGYAVGALVLITVLRAVVGAVDSLPVLPSALELVGLGYTGWFVWRYVLFKESREELLEEIEDLLGRAKPSR